MEFPKKGDIIIADAELHAGHEMGGHNPKKGNIALLLVILIIIPSSVVRGIAI